MAVFDADRPLRVAALFSGGASGVRYLMECDPGYGDRYEVVVGFSDDPDCPGVGSLREAGVPVETHDIESFYAERGAEMGDLDVRACYDAETRERVGAYDPDVVLLSGYMWILTEPMVEAYPILNVHPADLTVTDDEGRPVYTGADPVYDAVVAGEAETRSSVHFVTTDVDEGPVLVRSRGFEVNRDLVDTLLARDADDALRGYVDAHQEWMKWEGDGPAIATALALVAEGRIERDGSTVYVDGEEGYYTVGGSS